MKVLSLFDGMSCLQIALKELEIPIEEYYASEIDKHAIVQTQLNFPKTKQLGSVENWRTWDIDWKSIDLIGAGSPCQGFSFAGKQLAFDDPRSKLFFEFALILNHCKKLNPNVKFLLENVDMKREYMRIISEYVGIFPVNINSNLVSAQNRSRWYWSNIRTNVRGLFDELYTDIPQPKDRGILLKDILEDDVDEKYYISQAVLDRMNRKEYSKPQLDPDKTGSINTKNNSPQMSLDSGTTFISVYGKAPNQRSSTGRSLDKKHNYQIINIDGVLKRNQDKAACFTGGAHSGGNHSDMDLVCVSMRGRNPDNPSDRRTGSPTQQRLEPKTDGKTNCLTSVAKDNLVMIQLPHGVNNGGVVAKNGKTPSLTKSSWEHNNLVMMNDRQQNNFKNGDEKANTFLSTSCKGSQANGMTLIGNSRIRRLTPTEVSRLQTIPDWYIWKCSDTQIYRMCGNGWTVEAIKHILQNLSTPTQTSR